MHMTRRNAEDKGILDRNRQTLVDLSDVQGSYILAVVGKKSVLRMILPD